MRLRLYEEEFDRIILLKLNGNISMFCNCIRNLDNEELIRFLRYLQDNKIENLF